MKRSLTLLLALLPALAGGGVLSAPGGAIRFELSLTDQGKPTYRVDFRGKPVIDWSRLGIVVEDGAGFASGFDDLTIRYDTIDSTWEQPWGERRLIRNHYNEATFTLRSDAGALILRVRAYDDGIGFRYEIPEQPGLDVDTLDELTELRFADEGMAFWLTGDGNEGYEHLYQATPIGDVETAHTPMTVRLEDGTHVAVHEASLIDYPAYRLRQAGDGRFELDLRPWSDGVRARVRLPFVSPWRTLQVADTAVGLLNSNLILNLNEPNKLGDVSWVEPGKYAGIWWEIHRGLGTWRSGPRHAATTGAARAKIDFAADYGMSGVLAEGWNVGWDGDYVGQPTQDLTTPAPDFDLAAVAGYAIKKGVRLIGHHETGGHVSHYEAQMDDAFDLLARHGVRQVKTGYVGKTGTLKRVDRDGQLHLEHKDGQFAVRHQLKTLEAAAERRISINTHEPVKDTGLRRTYPNWLTREGARGQEFNIWGDPGNPPEHEVMLAFTRLLAGPMDFTPGIFDLDFEIGGKSRRVQTTLAKQLALYVTIYSPVQMVPDLRENYERYRDAFQFIVDVPTDWEDSIAIDGEVGEFVAIARKERGGNDWYAGAITDENARVLSVPLSFLDADTTYTATLYRDGADAHWDTNPYDYDIETRRLNRDNVLELRLAPGGGAAVRFEPED